MKDPEVDRLFAELVSLTGTSKGEAVKTALGHEIARQKGNLPMRVRLARALSMARASGLFAPDDHKRETNEMWGED
nr:type II toxin-antitoxin system VapB family antitoxin [uncultured Bosea sp.]